MIFHRKTLARHDNKCSLKIDRFFFSMPFIFWIDNCHNDWNQMDVIVVFLFWLKVQTHPNDFYSFAIVQRHINSVSSILYWWTITNKAINFDGCSDFCPFRANIDPFRKIMMLKNWEMHSTAMDLAKIFTKRNIEDESRRKRRAESKTLQSQAFTQIVALVCLLKIYVELSICLNRSLFIQFPFVIASSNQVWEIQARISFKTVVNRWSTKKWGASSSLSLYHAFLSDVALSRMKSQFISKKNQQNPFHRHLFCVFQESNLLKFHVIIFPFPNLFASECK